MFIGRFPYRSSKLWGPRQWWTPPCLPSPSLSCQQLPEAIAGRDIGLHSLDTLLCGGSRTGVVLLVQDSQGWLDKGSGKLNRIKDGCLGEQANGSGCGCLTFVVFQWEFHSVLISLHSNTNHCFNKLWLSKRPGAGSWPGKAVKPPLLTSIFHSCLVWVMTFFNTNCEAKGIVHTSDVIFA